MVRVRVPRKPTWIENAGVAVNDINELLGAEEAVDKRVGEAQWTLFMQLALFVAMALGAAMTYSRGGGMMKCPTFISLGVLIWIMFIVCISLPSWFAYKIMRSYSRELRWTVQDRTRMKPICSNLLNEMSAKLKNIVRDAFATEVPAETPVTPRTRRYNKKVLTLYKKLSLVVTAGFVLRDRDFSNKLMMALIMLPALVILVVLPFVWYSISCGGGHADKVSNHLSAGTYISQSVQDERLLYEEYSQTKNDVYHNSSNDINRSEVGEQCTPAQQLKLRDTFMRLHFNGRQALTIPNLYWRDDLESTQIEEWLDYAPIFTLGSEFEGACHYVDEYLKYRSFLVGCGLSIADLTIWSCLAGTGKQWERLWELEKFPNLVRWFNSISVEYGAVLNEVNAMCIGKKGSAKPKAAPKEKENQGSTDPANNINGDGEKRKVGSRPTFEVDLPNAEDGKVVLRFAPEPSGYLHIGHSKAALLNQYFADRYHGEVIIRFDDTNPTKESSEFVDNLLIDLKTLGIKYKDVTYTSDYFPQLMEMAEKLILEGKAYIDNTPREQIQKERMDGIESKCRNHSPEENMKLWKEMTDGSVTGLMYRLRGKLDMQDPNKSLRDPVYYRCNPMAHHRSGSKYKIYPTYDFACPFVDSIEGITHALRSSEYHDRNSQYYRIQEDMGIRKVHLYEFSHLNMAYTLLSKRKLLWFVQNGKVDGWDDPRFPTVQGIVRRGLQIEALVQFILEQGASKNLNLMEWDKLWTLNKKIIDPVCPRHTAVSAERVLLNLKDGPDEPFVRIIPRHKKFAGAGEKTTTFTKKIWIDLADAISITVDEEITLMDWGNAIVKEICMDEGGNINQLIGVLNPGISVKTTKLKLTWLPDTNELVALSLMEFDYLITKRKLDEDEDFVDVLNPCTKKESAAFGDTNMRKLKQGEILQLERKGYFRCDVPFVRPSEPIVLFAVPDGRQHTASN